MLKSIYDQPREVSELWVDALRLWRWQWFRLLLPSLGCACVLTIGVIFLGLYAFMPRGMLLMNLGSVADLPHIVSGVALHAISAVVVPEVHASVRHVAHTVSPRWLNDTIELGVMLMLPVVVNGCLCVLAAWGMAVGYCGLSKQEVRVWQSFVFVCRRSHWLFLYGMLQLVMIGLGMVCLVVPGVMLLLTLPFGVFFILHDHADPRTACSRAIHLARGGCWRTLGALVLPSFLLGMFWLVAWHLAFAVAKALGHSTVLGVSLDTFTVLAVSVVVVVCAALVCYVGYIFCLMNYLFQDLLKRKELSGGSGA